MPGLLVKQLPRELHRRIKARAAAHHRSMGAEVLCMLEQSVEAPSQPLSLEQLDALRVHGRKPLTDALLAEARRGRP